MIFDVLWTFLAVVLVLVSLFMIVIILIQDSKGAGLTSAFGAGPGGESLLGARMQRDVARWTAYLGIIFGAVVIAMGLLGNCRARYGSAGAAGAKAPTVLTPPAPSEGAAESTTAPSGGAPASPPAGSHEGAPGLTPPASTPGTPGATPETKGSVPPPAGTPPPGTPPPGTPPAAPPDAKGAAAPPGGSPSVPPTPPASKDGGVPPPAPPPPGTK
jgi:protein translocase SecG subunit